jgi:hypothetical protein
MTTRRREVVADHTKTTTAPLGILPGDSWVAELTHEDKTRTVLPLVGWLVTADGEIHPLPRSIDSTWVVRPRTANDEAAIAVSARNLRPETKPAPGSNWNQRYWI